MKEKFLFWIPRIITILAFFFMLMFSFDVFNGNESLSRKLLGFLIHNIPALIFAGVIIVAWKWEVIGGSLIILVFIVSCIFFRSFTGNPGSLVVTSPFLIAGILFILHHVFYRKGSIFS